MKVISMLKMLSLIFFTVLFFVLFLLPATSYALPTNELEFLRAQSTCNYSANIFLDLLAYENSKVAKYQFPDFKEDNILWINGLKIENTGNCTFPKSLIKIKISQNEKELQHPFGVFSGIEILELKVGEKYEISRVGFTNYIDSKNKKIFFGGLQLSSIGKYKIDISLEAQTQGSIGYGYNPLINNGFLNEFNVRSRSEIENLELSISNLNLAIWGLIFAIIIPVLITTFTEIRREKEFKQIRELLTNQLKTYENTNEILKKLIKRKKK